MFATPIKIERTEREFPENHREDADYINGVTRYKEFRNKTENMFNNRETEGSEKCFFNFGTSNRTKIATDKNNNCNSGENFINGPCHRQEVSVNEPDFMHIDVDAMKLEWPKMEPDDHVVQKNSILQNSAEHLTGEVTLNRDWNLENMTEPRKQDEKVSLEDSALQGLENGNFLFGNVSSERLRYESPLPELSRFLSDSLLQLPPLSPPTGMESTKSCLPENFQYKNQFVGQDLSLVRITRSAVRRQFGAPERDGSYRSGQSELSCVEDPRGFARRENSDDEIEKDFEKAEDMEYILKSYHKGGININDSYIYCDLCNRKWKGSCTTHGAYTHIMDTWVPLNTCDRAMRTVPEGLTVSTSGIKGANNGVWTCKEVPARSVYGPYKGIIVPNSHERGEYCWEVLKDGKLSHYVDARDPEKSNWMRYVNCARNVREQNLEAFQYRGKIYYRTTRKIRPNEELLVWYGFHFARKLGITWSDFVQSKPLERSGLAFSCTSCFHAFSNPVYLARHTKYCRGAALSGEFRDSELTGEERLRRLQNHSPQSSVRSGFHRSLVCMKVTTGDRPISCGACGARFRRRGELLEAHMKTHEGTKHNCCNKCGLWFQHEVALKIHVTTVHGKRRKETVRDTNKNERNMSTDDETADCVTDKKLFTCFECKCSFYSKISLEKHVKRRNANILQDGTITDEDGTRLKQDLDRLLEGTECSVKAVRSDIRRGRKRNLFTNLPAKKKQGASHRQNRSQTTSQELCRLLADMNQSLSGESSGSKTTSTTNPTDTTIFQEAELVLKSLKKRSGDSQPKRDASQTKTAETGTERKTSGEKTLLCEMCGSLFWRRATLENHLAIRHNIPSNRKKQVFSMDGPKRFVCNLCGIRYREKSTLELHLRIHEKDASDDQGDSDCYDEKPYQCKKCGVSFKAEMTLKYHMRIHKDDPPGKSYHSQESLRVTKEAFSQDDQSNTPFKKPFQCTECGTRYRELSTLNAHLNIHKEQSSSASATSTNRSYFSCRQCKSLFNSILTYEAHMKIHDVASSTDKNASKTISWNSSSSNTGATQKPPKKSSEKPLPAVKKTSKFTDRENGEAKKDELNSEKRSASVSDKVSSTHLGTSSFGATQCQDDTMSVDSLNETEISSGKERALPKLQIPTHNDTEKAQLKCDNCKSYFYSSTALAAHRKTHIHARPYDCLACGLCFKERASLDTHVLKHIREKELFCDLSPVQISTNTRISF